MKYDERACKFNMDTGCVELLLRDGRMISIPMINTSLFLFKLNYRVMMSTGTSKIFATFRMVSM